MSHLVPGFSLAPKLEKFTQVLDRRRSMAKLVTDSQFGNPDLAYVMLVDARRGLTREGAAELDTKLVLLLANHIGDLEVLKEAIELAKRKRPAAATLKS